VGVVEVPDPRLASLAGDRPPRARWFRPPSSSFDIAGLVAGASKGDGLGNQFLGQYPGVRRDRATSCAASSIRTSCNVAGRVEPVSDIEVVNTELALADLQTVEKQLGRYSKGGTHGRGREEKKGGGAAGRGAGENQPVVLDHARPGALGGAVGRGAGGAQAAVPADDEADDCTWSNVDEHGFAANPLLDAVRAFAARESAPVVPVCAKIEAEIADLPDEDKALFVHDMGMEEPGLARVIRAGYTLLGLQTYFTAGPKEGARLDRPGRCHGAAGGRRDPHRFRARGSFAPR